MLPGGTNERRTTTMEDRATQPLGCWKAEFRNLRSHKFLAHLDNCRFFKEKVKFNKSMFWISFFGVWAFLAGIYEFLAHFHYFGFLKKLLNLKTQFSEEEKNFGVGFYAKFYKMIMKFGNFP